ncbi:MAG TPA: PspC domain-containing protein [Solirubrobacterales bacterium]|jgi:phage shock protein PspC (stress-responsive transcriptional regulator)|nr:PspC domain-containing protein [Solirubrobacterales bacterium]
MESTGPENPTPTPPPAPEQPPPRRLMRSRTDRVVGGVCGGVARHFNLDPTLVRIGFVAGVVLWGATAVLYLAALLLMPEEPEGTAPAGPEVPPGAAAGAAAAAPPAGRNRVLTAIGVAVLVLVGGPILLGLGLAAGGLLVPFALLALAGLGTAWLVTGRRPPSGDAGGLLRMTLLGLGVLALLFVLSVGSFWAAAAGGDAIVAGAVVAAGVALAASAFARPARWLVLPALAVAIPAGFVAAAGVDLDGGIGEKRYRPAALAEVRDSYELGAGSLTVDLRDVDLPAGERRVHLDVGMGEAVVLVPEDVCVSTNAELGMGGVEVLGRDGGGVDVDWEDVNAAPAGTPRLVVDADVGFGAVEVRHDERDHRWQGPRRWRGDDGDDDEASGNEACAA